MVAEPVTLRELFELLGKRLLEECNRKFAWDFASMQHLEPFVQRSIEINPRTHEDTIEIDVMRAKRRIFGKKKIVETVLLIIEYNPFHSLLRIDVQHPDLLSDVRSIVGQFEKQYPGRFSQIGVKKYT
ncbi:MAG TPA: hypothetical protein VJ461_02410 [Candidatus Nanoarchaeia archaeon]|nr:hypothetical protein [Candidatus Nanoarchaeia archaeon]